MNSISISTTFHRFTFQIKIRATGLHPELIKLLLPHCHGHAFLFGLRLLANILDLQTNKTSNKSRKVKNKDQ